MLHTDGEEAAFTAQQAAVAYDAINSASAHAASCCKAVLEAECTLVTHIQFCDL